MKKLLLFLLLFLAAYLSASLYFSDKKYFLCPIKYSGDILVRSDSQGDGFFGAARNGNRTHRGLDLLAEVGAPVFASRLGMVVVSTNERNGMGRYVIIRHLGNLTTLYGHLSEVYVHKYQLVRQGALIGRTGKTGNARSRAMQPHLHFEVKKNGVPQDPMDYLK
ncbi:MAG: M23 family metallopeptidase [Candidatus Omnitrophica bacterium]|nr:M23 family metallopeptidase [Candidatus Omnitrophota bacterium]